MGLLPGRAGRDLQRPGGAHEADVADGIPVAQIVPLLVCHPQAAGTAREPPARWNIPAKRNPRYVTLCDKQCDAFVEEWMTQIKKKKRN